MIRLLPIIVLAALLAGCNVSTLSTEHIGMLGRTFGTISEAARTMTDEEEYYVGRAVAARLIGTYPLLKNDRLVRYVTMVGQELAMNSERPVTHGGYHFAILNTGELNAFASPGGTIFITRGMLESMKGEDELAAVLAHEIAHIGKRHGISAIQSSRWTEAVMLIGSDTAKTYGGNIGQLVSVFEGSVDDVFKTLVVNGYGRSQESEADMAALATLTKAGYDPSAMAGYLNRLIEAGKGAEGSMLSTHPGTDERLQAVRENLPNVSINPENLQGRTRRFIAEAR